MLTNLKIEENHNGVFRRSFTGLYVEDALTWEELAAAKQLLCKNFHEYRYQYPEFQGDAESRLLTLSKSFENDTWFIEYGSCDSPEQFIDTDCYRVLDKLPEQFVVTFQYMTKAEYGGRRWHKNGPHIGLKEPQCEHFKDEPEIEAIYNFHIYRKK